MKKIDAREWPESDLEFQDGLAEALLKLGATYVQVDADDRYSKGDPNLRAQLFVGLPKDPARREALIISMIGVAQFAEKVNEDEICLENE